MGFFRIEKHKVFYSDDRFIEINKPFYETLSAHEMIGINILGMDLRPNENFVKLKKLQHEKLREDVKSLPKQDFIKKWVEFEFVGKSARRICWEIIYDYFEIHKNGQIIDFRDFVTRLTDDYGGKNYSYPQGEVIGLDFKLSNAKNIYTKIFSSGGVFRIKINLTKVEKIKGSLTNVEIYTDNQIIKLSNRIEVINLFDLDND